MKDAFDVLMITHAGLCKGYADALKLILDIDEDDFGTLSFENGESLDDFSEAIRATIEERDIRIGIWSSFWTFREDRRRIPPYHS